MFSFYLTHEYWFAAAQLSLAMLGMGATLTLKDFKAIIKTPRAFAIGLSLQFVLVPLAAFFIHHILRGDGGSSHRVGFVGRDTGRYGFEYFHLYGKGEYCSLHCDYGYHDDCLPCHDAHCFKSFNFTTYACGFYHAGRTYRL